MRSDVASTQLSAVTPIAYDDFADRRATGRVIGTLSTSGHPRLGVDAEKILSIDDDALRIAPLLDAGFGRAVLAYGPFPKRAGIGFSVYMLNGHNTAQSEPLPDSFRQRMEYWMAGGWVDPRPYRLLKLLRSGRVRRVLRQIRRWKRLAKGGRPVPLIDENLAVGWYPAEVVADPREQGEGFVMHALGPENGELWVVESGRRMPLLRGVQNVPIYYVSVVRNGSIIYYVSSLADASALAAYPDMRPVAIGAAPAGDTAYLGIHQSVLGQIGWRLDSRIHGVRIAELPDYASWCAGAHAADAMRHAPRAGNPAEIGGEWQSLDVGQIATPEPPGRALVLDPGVPSGLIHAVRGGAAGARDRTALVWRCRDDRNYWQLDIAEAGCAIAFVSNGERQILESRTPGPRGGAARVQVHDDGSRVMAYIDGEPLFDRAIVDTRLNDATKVGFVPGAAGASGLRDFEAHPVRLRLPPAFDMGEPWFRKGTREIVADAFDGDARDLHDRITPVGGKRWNRIIGEGAIEITGRGTAKVRATSDNPSPGRTAYCVDWAHPDFVDLEVTITPPGNGPGERHRTTAGFIIYQDPDNYVTLNMYRSDFYPGGSVSTFFKFAGFEDTYDAIWTNVGERIRFGAPTRLRLCCDGERYLVFLNDESVLYRAFRDVHPGQERLTIHKVGLIANWEFGTDTGSTFERCRMRI